MTCLSISKSVSAGTWSTSDAVIQHVKPDDPPLEPELVPCYAARTPIKDKDWPNYIKKALTVVQASSKLKNYDVVPSMLSDQFELVDWLQVMPTLDLFLFAWMQPVMCCSHIVQEMV